MIARFGLLRRHPALSPEAFAHHWHDVHGPLAAALPGLRAYFQHRVLEKGSHAILGDWTLDGFSELHFDDMASMKAAFAAPSGGEAKKDLGEFLAEVKLVACEKHAVIPARLDPGPVVKRMSLIRRIPGLSDADFRREWLGVHSGMMKQWPDVLGYNQNLVVDRYFRSNTESATPDEVPVDGIVEIWFASDARMKAAHAAPIVAATMAHAREFLSEITPFLVETRRIV
ncbi:MAG: EthD family reductase [Rhodobacteraceae bacterium]|nr:EthD family reductase [Paracoccaceae bacterium]